MPPTKRIRAMVVDDHPIVRDGIRDILRGSGDFEVVADAANGAEAVETARSVEPDVIVMDVLMPEKDGVEACREIMEVLPNTRVLILTASTEEQAVIEAIAAGATGYVHKFAGTEELLSGLRDVASGDVRLPADTLRRVFARIRSEAERSAVESSGPLTDRESEILGLFASGKSYAEIAKIRGNSPVTIRNTVYRIQDKLGVSTKQEIVVWAVRNGLVDPTDPGSPGALAS